MGFEKDPVYFLLRKNTATKTTTRITRANATIVDELVCEVVVSCGTAVGTEEEVVDITVVEVVVVERVELEDCCVVVIVSVVEVCSWNWIVTGENDFTAE